MTKRAHWVQVLLFLVFIGGFFLLNLILPSREFSPTENRQLQQAPKFTLDDLFSGEFTSKFEKYTTDQFAFRDTWIMLKAGSELALGKKENNKVYLCDRSYGNADTLLVERFDAPADSTIQSNVNALNQLVEKTGVPVYFALIPGAGEIWKDCLPANAPMDSQKEVIDKAYALSEAVNVDMYGALNEHREEYIFYRTDHHWTTRGAYYGYTALADAMGFPARDISSYDVETVSTDFCGTIYSSSGFFWVEPDYIQRWVEQGENVSITNYPEGKPVMGTLYDDSYLDKKDKYSSFMGGNTPLIQIDTGVEGKPKLLIVRDSYMDSEIPFLLEDFSEIHVLDLRYYKAGLSAYVQQYGIDEILVCYSVYNFSTDTNIFLLGY